MKAGAFDAAIAPKQANPEVTPDEIKRCTEVLRRLADNPSALTTIERDDRVALLTAAGQVSRPNRATKSRLAKAFRRIERNKRNATDRQLRSETEIRAARRADVFSAPTELPPPPRRVPSAN